MRTNGLLTQPQSVGQQKQYIIKTLLIERFDQAISE
jgi:fructose-specific component phosphotransferase system IIB-like protein